MKAQGSTEYLVIFAAVLVVSLIVIFILGEMVKYHEESKVSKSQSYWAAKEPFGLIEGYVTQNTIAPGTSYPRFYVVLKNNDLRKMQLERISIYPYGKNTIRTATALIMKRISSGGLFGTIVAFPVPHSICEETGELVEVAQMEIDYKIVDNGETSSMLHEIDGPVYFYCEMS